MFALRRKAVESVSRLPTATGRGTKRYSSAHPEKSGDHAHGHAHDHGHAGPTTESLGTQFFVALAAVPICVGVYTISRPGADGQPAALSKVIDSYSHYQEKWAARNTLHTAMIEQAAFDRNLFQSTPGTKHVDLRFPEVFNTGSPYNVVAGQGPRNMDELVNHYNKLNADAEEKKVESLSKKE